MLKGLRPYRYKDNPEEERFAKAWDAENQPPRSLLAHMLNPRPDRPGHPPEPSPHDHTIAATVIQWLGSPVGQGWLRELGYERKDE